MCHRGVIGRAVSVTTPSTILPSGVWRQEGRDRRGWGGGGPEGIQGEVRSGIGSTGRERLFEASV